MKIPMYRNLITSHEPRLILSTGMKNGVGELAEEGEEGKGIKKQTKLWYVHLTTP